MHRLTRLTLALLVTGWLISHSTSNMPQYTLFQKRKGKIVPYVRNT